jgi:SagB-type dehydrogenase family enzyme
MKHKIREALALWRGGALLVLLVALATGCRPATAQVAPETIEFDPPRLTGPLSVEETLAQRRSVREYTDQDLTMAEIGQLFWAAQGVTADWGARTSPSAGALYPLEIYAVTRDGVYHYLPDMHWAERTPALGLHQALWEAGLRQDWIREAPVVFCIAAVYERTSAKYGDRAERYVHMEVGHAAENLLLQAVALDLGAVVVGAFHDNQVSRALGLPADQAPLYLIPVGHVE